MDSVTVPIYLINLDQDTERLKHMTEHLHGLGLNFERVPAILGTDMPDWLRPYFLREDRTIASWRSRLLCEPLNGNASYRQRQESGSSA